MAFGDIRTFAPILISEMVSSIHHALRLFAQFIIMDHPHFRAQLITAVFGAWRAEAGRLAKDNRHRGSSRRGRARKLAKFKQSQAMRMFLRRMFRQWLRIVQRFLEL